VVVERVTTLPKRASSVPRLDTYTQDLARRVVLAGGGEGRRTPRERLRVDVASLEVFGSIARGEDRLDSDIDLLYVLKPDARLGFRLFDLEDELATLFGRPVDLVARKSINKYIREPVLADAQPL
jgi:predicted nucleotidyltransferase